MGSFVKSKVGFTSRGKRCSGWLYQPKGIKKPPMVVMANGLGGEKTFGLPAFAEAYVQDGCAVYLFDYRYYGESEGVPRHLIRASRQLQDWEAAIERVKRLPNINRDKIILWGTSFSGGHVLVLAARHPETAAVVSHVPLTDGLTVLQGRQVIDLLKIAGAGLVDAVCSLAGVRCSIPIVGEPGKLAFLNQPGVVQGYAHLIPPDINWVNRCPAALGLTLPWYRPIRQAASIKCPVLMIKAREDNIISAAAMEQTAAQIEQGRLLEIEGGHFDFYEGDNLNEVYQQEKSFLIEYGII